MLRPKPGESLQEFLQRALAEGYSMADASAAWKRAHNLELDLDDDQALLSAPIEFHLAEGEDGEKRAKLNILAYTGATIDFGWYAFVVDLAGIRTKEKFPLLREHRRDRIVGTAIKASADNNGLYVEGEISGATADAKEVLALAKENFPWQASIGVQARKILSLEKGETHEVNGRSVEGPLDIWLESDVFETSIVALGADDNTAAVAMSRAAGQKNQSKEEAKMKKALLRLARRLLNLSADAGDAEVIKTLGLAEEATAQEILGKLEGHAPEIAAAKGDEDKITALAAALDQNDERVKQLTKQALAEYQAQLDADREAVAELCDKYGCRDMAAELAGLSPEAAKDKILEHLAAGSRPMGGRVTMGADERDKIHAAAVDGFSMQAGVKLDKPAAGHEEFRTMTLSGFAAWWLGRRGVNVFSLSRSQLADKVFELSGSQSDFPSIFRDVANKRLQSAYTQAPSTWRPFVNVVPASDFKAIYGVSLSDAPELELIGENGEYKTKHFSDKQETYSVGTYGAIVPLTRQMIVNDDLRAFARIPQLFGQAAARKRSDIVYSLITSNPTMSEDSTALFHADHSNIAFTAGHVSSSTLSEARQLLRQQTGPKGAKLDLRLSYILVPVAQETDAEIIVRSTQINAGSSERGEFNPWRNLTPIAEPRLDDSSEDAWYGVADPMQVDTIEVAFLDGNETPYMAEHEEFNRDAISFKVRDDFGAGVMDYRGFVKNAGA